MRYMLHIDVAGVAAAAPARFTIGQAESWRELHWMAKGAKPLERGGRLWAESEDRRVLYAADMELDHDPNIGPVVTEDLEALRSARAVAERRGYPLDLLDTYIRAVEDERVDDEPERKCRGCGDGDPLPGGMCGGCEDAADYEGDHE